uniref:CPL domain-containing protein n=1 Tax=Macrostomum lignano TaxID=282301 RepID=A0A1I8F6Z0_9PLAT
EKSALLRCSGRPHPPAVCALPESHVAIIWRRVRQQQQQQHIIECSAGHLMLKRLLPSAPDLVRLINDFVTDENIVSWLACNRGCFFLLQLYESCPEDCSLRDRVATLLLGGGGGGFATALQSALKRQYRGAQLLSERIKAKTEPGSSLVGDRSAGDAESQQSSQSARRPDGGGHPQPAAAKRVESPSAGSGSLPGPPLPADPPAELAARLGQPLDQCRRMQLTVRDALAKCTNDGGGGSGGFRLPGHCGDSATVTVG